MRQFLENRRGQIRVIEAFFAAVLMLSSLTLIPAVQTFSSGSENPFSSKSLNLLSSLDNDGHLADLLDQRNWTDLQNCLEGLVPPNIWFNLTIYDENKIPLNHVPICNGGAISDNIEAAEYLCVSYNSTYSIYTVRLQLAGFD